MRIFTSFLVVLITIGFGLDFARSSSAQDEMASKPIVTEAPETTTPQTLPSTQNWTTTTLISTNDDWSGVAGIVGYRGDDAATTTADIDPRTITQDLTSSPVNVSANRNDPDVFATGGVAEFDGIANPVVAMQGSGTADYPNLVIYLNTTSRTNVQVAFNARDIDAGSDVVQQLNVQYRVGSSGVYANVTGGYFADVTAATATMVTPVSVTLPAAANNQPIVEVRIITTNATGSDEFVGIDDVNVTSAPLTFAGPKLFKGRLNSSNEVPVNASTGFGYGRVVLNDAETQIKASFYWQGLTGNASAGHIHGPAAVGVNGPVIFNMTPAAATSGAVVDMTFSPTAAQIADLKAGLWYFNIHTAAFGGGEIRAQILRNRPRFDTDGDGDADYGIIRPGAGGASGQANWWTVLNTGTGTDPFTLNQWGLNSDTATPGDFDGDGRTDIAFWRSSGTPAFFILRSSTGTLQQMDFGLSGDDPSIVADYSGDGRDDPAIYRSGATATSQSFFWHLDSSGPFAGVKVVQPWGLGSDLAALGDFDGDGRADLAVTRNFSGQNVFIVYLQTGQVLFTPFGISGAAPDNVATGDFDGDGRTDYAVTRIEGGMIVWYYRPSGGGADVRIVWGTTASGDIESQGDYDGDGRTDVAVWRPTGGSTFHVLGSSIGWKTQRWGLDTDVPSIFDIH